ncbi:MAG: TIGR04282 family arsenosugar biosynthesis glycosyltransferase [Mycobacterium sp.]
MTTLIVIAKEPVPGRAKTRLHPPLTLEQAAHLAAAAIDDTLAAVADVPASRRILLFDGETPPRAAAGYEIMPQSSGGLDERLADAFDALAGPTVLIGMDTPQLRTADLAPTFGPWGEVDAWFGPAADGGFWALGMREPRGDLIRDVPMSREDTGAAQLARLQQAGLRVGMLRELTDVDTIDDARRVAAAAPATAFARLFAQYAAAAPVR